MYSVMFSLKGEVANVGEVASGTSPDSQQMVSESRFGLVGGLVVGPSLDQV